MRKNQWYFHSFATQWRSRTTAVTLFTLASMAAPTRRAGATPGVIVGENTLTEVSAEGKELPPVLRENLDALGTLELDPFVRKDLKLMCTAAHIGNGLVITAGHCLLGARSCNGLVVRFGVRRGRISWVSRCVEVIQVQADDSRYSGPQEDFALFRVSNAPPAALPVAPRRLATAPWDVTVLSYPRPLKGRIESLWWSGPCQVTGLEIVDLFEKPRPATSFGHNCDTAGGSNGAPLLDLKTGTILGIHQTGATAPASVRPGAPGRIQSHNVGKHIIGSSLQEAIELARQGFKTPPPQHIVVGKFGAEVFPVGIPGPLRLHVATLGQGGAAEVSFTIRHGAQTTLEIMDGHQGRHLIHGPMQASQLGRKRFPAPVRIFASTQGGTYTLDAALEEIKIED